MDSGSFTWMVVATALVLFMTPGLAFFYGGLVRVKSVVSMLMLSFGSLGLIAVLWILYGASMSTVDNPAAFAGDPFADFGLAGITTDSEALLGVAYGATFAIITTALISGAIADRAKFWSWMLFAGVWATLVYFPVAAWVWGGGWIGSLHELLGDTWPEVIDYAGGTVVHINAGAAALALALVLGKRLGFDRTLAKPHNVPLVLLGAAILWFGWFGFNGGAEAGGGEGGAIGDATGLIILNTLAAAAAGVLGWIGVEQFRQGKSTAVGAASGAVSGLVAITPACANLEPVWALLLGLLAGAASALAIGIKYRFGYDDSLDVVAVHLVSGMIGTIYLGFFATGTGLFTGGGVQQLIVQTIPAIAVAGFSFVMALIIALAIEKTVGFRITSDDEIAGIDLAVHGEEGYSLVDTNTQAELS